MPKTKTLAALIGLAASQAMAVELRIVRSGREYALKIKESPGLRSPRANEILDFLNSPRAEKHFELLKEVFGLMHAENMAELRVHVKNLTLKSHMKNPNLDLRFPDKTKIEKVANIMFAEEPVVPEEEFTAAEEAVTLEPVEKAVANTPVEQPPETTPAPEKPAEAQTTPSDNDNLSLEDLEKELDSSH